jgi:uncharacterized DUF497 family protein
VKSSFEWDLDKAEKTISKHNIDCNEASSVFDNPMFITFLDEEHSIDEQRYITIGLSVQGRLVLVAHSERSERIRIISARKATKNEEKFYQETG